LLLTHPIHLPYFSLILSAFKNVFSGNSFNTTPGGGI